MNSSRSRGILVLLSCRDERGIFRFPVDPDLNKGLFIKSRGGDVADVKRAIAERIGHPELFAQIRVEHVFEGAVTAGSLTDLSLCVAALPSAVFQAPPSWPTLPDILRSLPPDRERLVFMKAVQLLAGAHEETLTAIELTDEVRKALLRSLDPDFQG